MQRNTGDGGRLIDDIPVVVDVPSPPCFLLTNDETLSLPEFLAESERLAEDDADDEEEATNDGYHTPSCGRLTPANALPAFGRLTPLEFFPGNGRVTPSGFLTPLVSACATPTPLHGRVTPLYPFSPLTMRKHIAVNDKELNVLNESTINMREGRKTGPLGNNLETTGEEELYPNCDVTIWLRSCREEVVEPLGGEITGCVPDWLTGTLLRNGPGSLEVGDMTFDHLFDSSALLHRFAISKGQVTYQSRFLQSETYKRNQAAQRIVVTEFGTKAVPDPCQSIFKRVSALFRPGEAMSDNAMISVYPFGDEFYTFTEAPIIHRIDPVTLATMQRVNVSDHVGIVNHTSHPHVMQDGTVYNMGLSVSSTGPRYTIIEFPPSLASANGGVRKSPFEQARVVGGVKARWPLHPAYMHTFGITDHYFLIVEQPLSVSVAHMVKSQLRNEPVAASLRWYKDQQTLFHLVRRSDGKRHKTFYADAFFYLHIVNQYEDQGHVVVDICCYKDAAMLDCMYIESLKGAQQNPDYAQMFRGRPLRFVLPLTSTTDADANQVTLAGSRAGAYRKRSGHVTLTPEVLCDLGCETPRINYDEYLGKPYRYFYAISSDVDLENPGTLIKVDIATKSRLTWCEENVFPSEPIFVPAPNPQAEDDGVVLASLVWGQGVENIAGLLILDATTWTELARAKFVTPGPVPKCLHGWFTNTVH